MNELLSSSAHGSVALAGSVLDTDPGTVAWRKLQEGNARWAAGCTDAASARSPQRRADLLLGQNPFAMVLACADSRVPAELVFDQGLGDLFVVRTAGHAVDDTVLGSLEYAVSILGVDLVLVLGHQGCGAVAAAATAVRSGTTPDGYIGGLVERLTPHIGAAHDAGLSEGIDLSRWHAAATVDLLQQLSSVLRASVFDGEVRLVAATYELHSGLVVPSGNRSAVVDQASKRLLHPAGPVPITTW